jgi:hypothetical protein
LRQFESSEVCLMARPIEPTPTLDGAEMKERQRRADGKFQFEPTHKLHMFSSAAPDLRSEAMKRACWGRKPLPPEVLADALQDRCHDGGKATER